MKSLRIILLFAAAALLTGCFKDVSYKTTLVLKPLQQQASGDTPQPIADAKTYAFDVDTAQWTVATYDEALAGVITSWANSNEKRSAPSAVGQPYEQEGAVGWLQMSVERESQMVLVVDPVNKLYAYTQQQTGVNLPKLFVSVVFKPWKEGLMYDDGNWKFFNNFYKPPVFLECIVRPSVQIAEGGNETALPNDKLKIYAFAADTTDWYLASFSNAVSGKITSKTSSQTRSNPDFPAYPVPDTGTFSMKVSKSVLMVVVVDMVNNLYAYSKQVVDLEGTSPTFPIVFRPWQQEWISVDEGWRVVNEKLAPKPSVPSNQSTGKKR